MALQQVSPGGWIHVRLPADSWPVHISIDGGEPMPAFVDHVRDGDGGVETWAKVRCPPLRPGRHRVTARSGSGAVEAVVHVV